MTTQEEETREPVFWLGTHRPHWIKLTDVPLMISRFAFNERMKKTIPESRGEVFVDGGGFTQLDKFGGWENCPPRQFVRETRRIVEGVKHVSLCGPQDWMCEEDQLKKTGKTVAEHQRLTVENFVELKSLAPDLPFLPVLQGYFRDDYLRCVDLYLRAGVELTALPLVGLGTVCRRQETRAAENIIAELARAGLRLHGFGFKLKGLAAVGHLLPSSDSLAWSYQARRSKLKFAGCPERHSVCNNCFHFAHAWRSKVVERIEKRAAGRPLPLPEEVTVQGSLFD